MGTPNYMSPEQCRGAKVDHRTDIYSFGCLVHQVLTGRLPFEGESVMDILVQHMTAPPPHVSQHNPELKPELDAPVLAMLDKTPESRPATVGAAVDALTQKAKDAGYAVTGAPIATASSSAISGAKLATGSGATTPAAGGSFTAQARGLTPAQLDLAQAKTVEGIGPGSDQPNKSFLASETDVSTGPALGPPPRKRAGLVVGVVLGLAVLGAAAVFVVPKLGAKDAREERRARRAPATATEPAPPATTTQTAGAATSAPSLQPVEIDLTFATTPDGAAVFEGARRLGVAPGPIRLPYGHAKVTLTVKADGYKDGTIDVVPDADKPVAVTLTKAPALGPIKTAPAKINKDLEPLQ
jgi:serine/threonine-protein kinase